MLHYLTNHDLWLYFIVKLRTTEIIFKLTLQSNRIIIGTNFVKQMAFNFPIGCEKLLSLNHLWP